jgi:hypothetical protein
MGRERENGPTVAHEPPFPSRQGAISPTRHNRNRDVTFAAQSCMAICSAGRNRSHSCDTTVSSIWHVTRKRHQVTSAK